MKAAAMTSNRPTNDASDVIDAQNQLRVLLVDDDVDFSATVLRALSKSGRLATRAANADEALAALDRADFDIALVDVHLPGIEGPELIPLMRSRRRGLQIIVITGRGSVDLAVRSLRAGAFDFLEKPFGISTLDRAMIRALEHRNALDTTALYRVSQTIFGIQHFDRLPEAIVKIAMQVMAADAVSLLLPGMDGKLLVAHAYGLEVEVQKRTRITIGEGIAGRIAETGVPTVINGSASDRAEFAGSTARTRIKSSIVYPIKTSSRLVGMLTFNRLTNDRPYDANDLENASVLASQVMLALENLRLSQQTAVSEKLAAVGQLAAGIAHEINTPIQFVGDGVRFLGAALDDLSALVRMYEDLVNRNRERLQSDPLLADIDARIADVDVDDLRVEVPKAMARTTEGLGRVAAIVRSVKNFGRPDTSSKEPTDVAKLVEATLTVARGEYKYVADVETSIGELPLIMAHAGELSQVLLNLVVNAAHAIADKSRATGDPTRGKIDITARAEHDSIVLVVSDTGCGIPEDVQMKVFDPFFTTKEIGRGTGLGLSIVRGIVVDKHQGHISLESEIGRGTRFTIRLPVDSAGNTLGIRTPAPEGRL
jgi:signal transduction histidine kinase/DNA-binding response OmpR family regulator